MSWLLYMGIYVALVLVPFIIIGVSTQREDYTFFDRRSTAAMKKIAILIVVLCHYMGTYGEGTTIFTPLGGIGVSIFLILSAYGLTKSWSVRGEHGGVVVLLQ